MWNHTGELTADNVFDNHFGQKAENPEGMRATEQRSVSLKQDAREPRLAMEVDVTINTEIHKRMEGAEADQAKNGDSYFAKRVQAGLTSSTSFGMKAEPPSLPRRDDLLVDIGAAAPTADGGLLLAGIASSGMRTTCFRSLPSWALGGKAKERSSRTDNNQLALPY